MNPSVAQAKAQEIADHSGHPQTDAGQGHGKDQQCKSGTCKDADCGSGLERLSTNAPTRIRVKETIAAKVPTGVTGNGGVKESAAMEKKSALQDAMRDMQSDAPACDVCGTITVRSGTCYKCLNCGNSMGCS
ncbi:MAG: hypothetical protein HC898_06115 [Phycisphaerales bacterium]|nr:hypothetical protein [Phycisphaerales bacterium]